MDAGITSSPASARRSGRSPGLWPAIASATAFGVLAWVWAIPQIEAPQAAAASSALAEVDATDVKAAIKTMDDANGAVTRQEARRGCDNKLAWVALSRPPGDAPVIVRVRSGAYISPAFTITGTPARVAIPYPAPYATGRGVLSVLAAGGEVVVALAPAWHIPPGSTDARHEVTWRPSDRCEVP